MILLLSEHMLDTRADFRFRIVGPPHRLGHSAAFRLLAMNVADEAILVQERLVGRRSVGGIGPHSARRIAAVEQALAQTTALIGSRICGVCIRPRPGVMSSFGGRLIALKQHERRSGDANLIERCVNRLKQFSRIAARYEKTARAYLSMLSISMNLALCLGMGWHKKGAGCCSLGIGGFHYARHCHVYWNIVC
jgi:hypothetical protein